MTKLFLFSALYLGLVLQMFISQAQSAADQANKTPTSNLAKDLEKMISNKDLREDLLKYLDIAKTSHKARSHLRMLGAPSSNNQSSPGSNGIREALELILEPVRQNMTCKKQCNPCGDEVLGDACPCNDLVCCPSCPLPLECIPPCGQKCPVQRECKCNDETTTNSTSTTKKPLTTPVPLDMFNKTCSDQLINIENLKKLFNQWIEQLNLKPNPTTTPNTTPSQEMYSAKSTKQKRSIASLFSFSAKASFRASFKFDVNRNLKILCKNETSRNHMLKLLDEVPVTTGGAEMKLAFNILSSFGDKSVKPLANVTNQQRNFTYMNSRENLKKIVSLILEEFKRNKCNCESCAPKKRNNCDEECKNVTCPQDYKCPPCGKITNCPSIEGCPDVTVCQPCPPDRDPDNDGDPSELDDVDEKNVVEPNELDKPVPCKGFTCPVEEFCGKADLNPLTPPSTQSGYLNGGEDEIYGEWPSHARLKFDLKRNGGMKGFCSGVLISDMHVLTAAHCVALPRMGDQPGVKLNPEEITVFLADHDTNKTDEHEVHYNVSSICTSKNFDDPNGDGSRYDFSILTLSSKVKFNDYIQPVCLPYEPLPLTDKRKCFVIGAGITKYSERGDHKQSKIVQKMAVERTSCRSWGIRHDDRSRHCFTKSKGKGDSCGGDSGGPVMCLKHNRWILAGLVSYGSEKCDGTEETGWVGVYSRIPAILKIMNEDCKI